MREQPVLSNGIEEVTRPRGSLGLRRDPAGRAAGGRAGISGCLHPVRVSSWWATGTRKSGFCRPPLFCSFAIEYKLLSPRKDFKCPWIEHQSISQRINSRQILRAKSLKKYSSFQSVELISNTYIKFNHSSAF